MLKKLRNVSLKAENELCKLALIEKLRFWLKIYKKLDKEEKEYAKLLLNCNNESTLKDAFFQIKNEELQRFILSKIDSIIILEEIALSDKVKVNLRKIAIKKLNSQEIFEKVGVSNDEDEIRVFALQNLIERSDKFWYDIVISSREESETAKFCITKIQSEKILADIVKYEEKPGEMIFFVNLSKEEKWKYSTRKKLSVMRISNEEILKELFKIENLLDEETKFEILKKIKDESFLMKVYERNWIDLHYYCYYRGYEKFKLMGRDLLELNNHTSSLVKIVIDSEDKEFISRCIPKFNKEELCKVMEKSDFWYTTLLAKRRLKKCGLDKVLRCNN